MAVGIKIELIGTTEKKIPLISPFRERGDRLDSVIYKFSCTLGDVTRTIFMVKKWYFYSNLLLSC